MFSLLSFLESKTPRLRFPLTKTDKLWSAQALRLGFQTSLSQEKRLPETHCVSTQAQAF